MQPIELLLVGIGTGNPEHLTLQAIRVLNGADLILLPRKGAGKEDLAELRRAICDEVLRAPVEIAAFDLPVRDAAAPSYLAGVEAWHDAIAAAWTAEITARPAARRVALLVWGDPSLYDSTLRIAARLRPAPRLTVVPGITSLQALTAAHAVPLNRLGAPVVVTTGRRLRADGWPPAADTVAVMLDADCTFTTLPPEDVHIWWGAYVGMAEQIVIEGPLSEVAPRIVAARAEARARHGWVMDIYLLHREVRT